MNSGIKEIYKLIKKNETITIFGHINPDGDCYGSSLALRELIRLNFPKKKVFSLAGTLPQLEQRLTTQDKDVSDETHWSRQASIISPAAFFPAGQSHQLIFLLWARGFPRSSYPP